LKEQTGTFEGTNGLQLFYKSWLPDAPPKAILVIIHGVGEHIGRYQNLVEALVPAGYLLTGFDQRGHGQSPGPRGHIDSWDEYRQDIGIFLKLAQGLAPGLPSFIYGHSQGSLEVLDFIQHTSDGLAGAIISGTALEPKDAAPPHLVMLAKILSGIYPNFQMKVKFEGASLSNDPQIADDYKNDPLVHRLRTARWGTESLKTIEWIKAHPDQIDLPVLFLHGDGDQVVTAAGALNFYDQIQFPDKTIRIYPDCQHEPHNEMCHANVVEDIANWMETHLNPQPS
jgi:alpha-beta hydrolase superfamily lysophospholipase